MGWSLLGSATHRLGDPGMVTQSPCRSHALTRPAQALVCSPEALKHSRYPGQCQQTGSTVKPGIPMVTVAPRHRRTALPSTHPPTAPPGASDPTSYWKCCPCCLSPQATQPGRHLPQSPTVPTRSPAASAWCWRPAGCGPTGPAAPPRSLQSAPDPGVFTHPGEASGTQVRATVPDSQGTRLHTCGHARTRAHTRALRGPIMPPGLGSH